MKKDLKIRNKKGRVTFDFYLDQFRSCFNDLRLFFPNNLDINIVVKEGFRTELEAIQSKRDFINIMEFIRIDIAYTLVFIGLSQAGQKAIGKHFIDKYESIWIGNIIKFLSLKPHPDSKLYYLWKELCNDDGLKRYILANNTSSELIDTLREYGFFNKLYEPEVPFF